MTRHETAKRKIKQALQAAPQPTKAATSQDVTVKAPPIDLMWQLQAHSNCKGSAVFLLLESSKKKCSWYLQRGGTVTEINDYTAHIIASLEANK